VLVALSHQMMRRFTLELLDRDHACWSAEALDDENVLRAARDRRPDLVVLDAATFGACHCAEGCGFPCGRMVVVGPERDLDYRAAVLADGAGGWVARDDVADQLSAAMRAALGCTHVVCPPAAEHRPSVPVRTAHP
jgi:DNA-binding NarL/FixJ family response regulator